MIGVVTVAIMVVVSIITVILAVIGVVVTLEVNGALSVFASPVIRVAVAVVFVVSAVALGAVVVVVVAAVALVIVVAVGASDVVVVTASVKLPFRVVILSSDVSARGLPLGALLLWSIVTEEVVLLSFVHRQTFASLFRVPVHDFLDFLEVFLAKVLTQKFSLFFYFGCRAAFDIFAILYDVGNQSQRKFLHAGEPQVAKILIVITDRRF